MKQYELVREVQNLCANNQMRDVFFDEIETDDPVAYVRSLVKDKQVELEVDRAAEDRITVYVNATGTSQKFLFTEI